MVWYKVGVLAELITSLNVCYKFAPFSWPYLNLIFTRILKKSSIVLII